MSVDRGVRDVEDFDTEVIDRSREVPVLVDFWAAWCGPCRALAPVLERLADEADGRWELAKVDTEAHPNVARRHAIRSIPAVKLFADGEVVDEFVGALPEAEIRDWLGRALPSPGRARLDEARGLVAEGKTEEALATLEQMLADDPADHPALIELARIVVWDEPDRARELLEAIGAGAEHGDAAESLRQIAKLFVALDRPEALPRAEIRTTYLSAIAALRNRDFPTALDGFITVIGRDRAYDEDGARRACLAIFDLLGADDPVTRGYRSRFASALYA